ncbi:hypothetical protein SBOR_4705 [Sclerotinia borealis F-4128]|uniref:Uncharacterized protein n=1 Tax=Sclerotinia borealis (strain F-4128) TaxID=1432307 RepID=W9CG62_SCLBF|nr:hypothetical protein SBOR_4705 [Sclerotinia borealis F-4128]
MNAAVRALHQVTLSIDCVKKLPPLEPYEGLDSPPQLMYQDQIGWITNYATNNACCPIILSNAKSGSWQQMLMNIETVNRLRHPNVQQEYIKWRSQDMLVRRLWPKAMFPGMDPDELYTQIRKNYCTAARKLTGELDEQGLDYESALIQLKKTYNKKLAAARKAKAGTGIGEFLDRICAIKAMKSNREAGEMEAEDEFVVVEVEDGDVDEGEGEGKCEEDDWDML